MTPAHRRQLAEQVYLSLMGLLDSSGRNYIHNLNAIENALSSAYRAGQIAALKEAAEAAKDAELPQFYMVLANQTTVRSWLRARASQVEEGEGT